MRGGWLAAADGWMRGGRGRWLWLLATYASRGALLELFSARMRLKQQTSDRSWRISPLGAKRRPSVSALKMAVKKSRKLEVEVLGLNRTKGVIEHRRYALWARYTLGPQPKAWPHGEDAWWPQGPPGPGPAPLTCFSCECFQIFSKFFWLRKNNFFIVLVLALFCSFLTIPLLRHKMQIKKENVFEWCDNVQNIISSV